MKEVFADTCFFVALINPADTLHAAAVAAAQANAGNTLVVTDEVLTELLNFYSSYGPKFRSAAVKVVETLAQRSDVVVVAQSRDSFAHGFALYSARADKSYSATDCISLVTMKERNIESVLTNDYHFRQEGFTILLDDER